MQSYYQKYQISRRQISCTWDLKVEFALAADGHDVGGLSLFDDLLLDLAGRGTGTVDDERTACDKKNKQKIKYSIKPILFQNAVPLCVDEILHKKKSTVVS